MVFENLTLVELHLDGDARIGPSFGGDGEEPTDAEGAEGGRRFGLAVAGLLVLAGGAAVAAWLRDRRDGEGRITIEQAAEQ